MKTSGEYNNGQMVSEQKGDILTYYHKDGKIKARGMCVDGVFQGKWLFYKKEGYLWQEGHFKDSQKHGIWTRYKADGSIEKEEVFEEGKKTS
ncbi:MAG TPA: hypothetical protein VFT59_05315 [Candidatus Saccharimonadales bacterium]|nr:hypothetical protein [Candidatus Saccharimonadales bacterium]